MCAGDMQIIVMSCWHQICTAICIGVRYDDCEWKNSQARHCVERWGPYRVGSIFWPLCCCNWMVFRNVVHRHEPPVSSRPIRILHHDTEREFIVVDKPGSIVRSLSPPALPSSTLTTNPLVLSSLACSCLRQILQEHFNRNSSWWVWFLQGLSYVNPPPPVILII